MREAIELYLEAAAESGQALPAKKSTKQYIPQGLLKKEETADEYFMTNIKIKPAVIA